MNWELYQMILIFVLEIGVILLVWEVEKLHRRLNHLEKTIQTILNDFDMHQFYGEGRH